MDLNPLEFIASQALTAPKDQSNELMKSQWFANAIRYRQERLLEAPDCDCVGFTALHWAVLCNMQAETKTLIKSHPVLVNAPSQFTTQLKMWHMTPVFLAAIQGHIYLTSYLLTQKADSSIASKKIVALHEATIKDSWSVDASKPFDEAASRGFHEIVLLLIKFDINTLLHYETNYGSDDVTTFCCIRIGSTRSERIDAIKALQASIDIVPLEGLILLPKKHPSLYEGRLALLYGAYIDARKFQYEL